jgi:hypothetical protein
MYKRTPSAIESAYRPRACRPAGSGQCKPAKGYQSTDIPASPDRKEISKTRRAKSENKKERDNPGEYKGAKESLEKEGDKRDARRRWSPTSATAPGIIIIQSVKRATRSVVVARRRSRVCWFCLHRRGSGCLTLEMVLGERVRPTVSPGIRSTGTMFTSIRRPCIRGWIIVPSWRWRGVRTRGFRVIVSAAGHIPRAVGHCAIRAIAVLGR